MKDVTRWTWKKFYESIVWQWHPRIIRERYQNKFEIVQKKICLKKHQTWDSKILEKAR